MRIPEHKIRLHRPYLGGAFGSQSEILGITTASEGERTQLSLCILRIKHEKKGQKTTKKQRGQVSTLKITGSGLNI